MMATETGRVAASVAPASLSEAVAPAKAMPDVPTGTAAMAKPVSVTAGVQTTDEWKPAISYAGKVVLAPMVRSGELPIRMLSLRHGADIVWGPEIVDHALIKGIPAKRVVNEKINTIDFIKEPGGQVLFRTPPTEKSRLIFQLGSAQPETAVAAAKIVAGDVAGIDLNCGCPKPFSTTGGMGSALLSDVDRLCAILTALIEQVGRPYNIGVSAKIRVLPDVDETVTMIRRICQTGIIGLTVHLRTIPMRPREPALRHRLARIVEVCKEEGVVLLANGDVRSREEAEELIAESGVSGIMIARGAERNPSCFRSAAQGGPLDSLEVGRELLLAAIEYDNHFSNTKYCLLKVLGDKSKQQSYRDVQKAKTMAEMLVAVGLDRGDASDIRPQNAKERRLEARHANGHNDRHNKTALAA